MQTSRRSSPLDFKRILFQDARRYPRQLYTPHPSPSTSRCAGSPRWRSQGEREEDATSMANVQNKPNSAASEEPPDVYAESRVETVTPVCRPTASEAPAVGDLDG